ncbi:MAG: hypothetical protein F4X64_16405 [Chloroflexi bacterium]|nr:hypothetical protein [Chloroflexota bacterium]
MTTTNESLQTWESVSERMPELLKELRCSDLLRRDSRGWLPKDLPKKGVYVFYGHHKFRGPDKPIYVGRTDRVHDRLREHGQHKATHNKATFAFILAEEEAAKCEIVRGSRSRNDFQNDMEFKPFFYAAKMRIRDMDFRVVEIPDPIEQAVFEVYAALVLETTVPQGGYNDFSNH